MAEFFRCAVLEGNKRPTLRYTLAAARVLILAPLGAAAQGALEGTIRHAGTGAVVAGARKDAPSGGRFFGDGLQALRARQLRQRDGHGGALLPQSQHAGRGIQPFGSSGGFYYVKAGFSWQFRPSVGPEGVRACLRMNIPPCTMESAKGVGKPSLGSKADHV